MFLGGLGFGNLGVRFALLKAFTHQGLVKGLGKVPRSRV